MWRTNMKNRPVPRKAPIRERLLYYITCENLTWDQFWFIVNVISKYSITQGIIIDGTKELDEMNIIVSAFDKPFSASSFRNMSDEELDVIKNYVKERAADTVDISSVFHSTHTPMTVEFYKDYIDNIVSYVFEAIKRSDKPFHE